MILWGGLRGAVTMVLALAAADHPGLSDAQQHFVGVLALGFVIFTLFVGAPTLRPLLHLLGLHKLSATEAALRDRVMALSRGEIRDQLDVVARDYGLAPRPVDQATQPSARDSEVVPLIPGDRIAVGLLTLATRERDLYYLHFRDRTISRHMARVVMSASDHLFDLVKTGGVKGYHRAGSEMVRLSQRLRLGLWIHRRTGWSDSLSAALADRFESLLVMQLVLRGLVAFNNDSIAALVGAETCETLQTLLANAPNPSIPRSPRSSSSIRAIRARSASII
ncbi:MAG: hypothetical protein FJX67_00665 [Alphaproteobacteria bacterium]|nr:hypothetical protein [Alphaproteobacteria bacterium]